MIVAASGRLHKSRSQAIPRVQRLGRIPLRVPRDYRAERQREVVTVKTIQVKPGSKLRLKDIDPSDTSGVGTRAEADALLEKDRQKLSDLHEKLYVENARALLVILQGMDTGGKDGTIKHVMSGLNPSGTEVVAFKPPSEEERDHDFLWRVARKIPRRGNIGIFNRSHYEDVLIVRVHKLVPKKVWEPRYDFINRFESLLSDNGTRVLKFFLHISKAEQKARLEARLSDPQRLWKFDPSDISERKLWDDYQKAYEDALTRCSTEASPWHIVPADKKWYRNLVVARTIVDTLEGMKIQLPAATIDPKKIKIV